MPCDVVSVGVADVQALEQQLGVTNNEHRVRILGHSQHMPALLAAADVVVTKPGGATMAQALAAGCALMLCTPLAGYEQGNLEYLLSTGCAIRVYEDESLPVELTELLSNRRRLLDMQIAARRAAYPAAAHAVARKAIEIAAAANATIRTASCHQLLTCSNIR